MSCTNTPKQYSEILPSKNVTAPFDWRAANVYFLLTDRFHNPSGEATVYFDRTKPTGKLRGFMGGNIRGITQKISEGYFTELGISAIWFTPVVEQIHGSVDEGTGNSYGFHGYWAKDWTSLDPNFGTEEDLEELVRTAHSKGIRILMDAVVNHTGPVTDIDPVWPEDWVRIGPTCLHDDYESTVSCTLVDNLPDILTENDEDVGIPEQLAEKWKKEGRYEQEMEELDTFFERTGHSRAPRFYIMKWLTDFIRNHGIDGYRIDTVKHTEEYVWAEFRKECDQAYADWKEQNPNMVMEDIPFFTVGEVYNYNISSGRNYDFGDHTVDYFDNGFNSLINFEFKGNAKENYETLFSSYSQILQEDLKGLSVLNYMSSHDDGEPFDKQRKKPFETGTKLLLAPGASQIYYGDESARSLDIEGTVGDATLRSYMNWEAIDSEDFVKEVLAHWQKLGKFRRDHPAVGAGVHECISEKPYLFRRVYTNGDYVDVVLVGLDLPKRKKELDLLGTFSNGTRLRDAYSGEEAMVRDGILHLTTDYDIVLLEVI